MLNSQHSSRTVRPRNPGSGSSSRVAKRSSNACSRCRRQKIRCSGTHPCDACSRRSVSCQFNPGDQKITVTRGYLEDLQNRLMSRESHHGSDPQTPRNNGDILEDDPEDDEDSESLQQNPSSPPARRQRTGSGPSRGELSGEDNDFTNPLSTGQSAFWTAPTGRSFYLGTSSNWSFTRRILSMTHEHLFQTHMSTDNLLFDGSSYDLDWNGSRIAPGPETPPLPTMDYAIFLINAVKFHCGQTFHLFDEETFMNKLYAFFEHPPGQHPLESLGDEMWFVHFLLILAFGKAFVSQKTQGRQLPGIEFFTKALHLLPGMYGLWQDPVTTTEILCCIALYLQCLDIRAVAHNYIGQAVRMAMSQGMHTDMPVQHLGEQLVERSRRAFWTAYVLDCQMTSLVGLPQSINDTDLHPQLPNFSGSVQRSIALSMQIKLSRILVSISRTIYSADVGLNKNLLRNMKNALENTAEVADEIQRWFPLQLENSASCLSRTSAYVHLLYHQCIILAARPLLFCFLKIRLESVESLSAKLNSSKTLRNLMQMCINSSLQTIMILERLHVQELLETFLPFDLESLHISMVNLIVAPSLDTRFLENASTWLQKARSVLDEMIASGNKIARFRKCELEQLEDLLARLPEASALSAIIPSVTSRMQADSSSIQDQSALGSAEGMAGVTMPTPISGDIILDERYLGNFLTTAHVMDVANAIDLRDTEWLSQAIMEHNIW